MTITARCETRTISAKKLNNSIDKNKLQTLIS